jgi:hypothetical protein
MPEAVSVVGWATTDLWKFPGCSAIKASRYSGARGKAEAEEDWDRCPPAKLRRSRR